jgi:hypothetical protein
MMGLEKWREMPAKYSSTEAWDAFIGVWFFICQGAHRVVYWAVSRITIGNEFVAAGFEENAWCSDYTSLVVSSLHVLFLQCGII